MSRIFNSEDLDLMFIKEQIEATEPVNGLGIDKKEFMWGYRPDCYFELMEEIESEEAKELGHDMAVAYQVPSNLIVHALIHNHTKGSVAPSIRDIYTFSRIKVHIRFLDYSIIASTISGEVEGFNIMQYIGKPDEAFLRFQAVRTDLNHYEKKIVEEMGLDAKVSVEQQHEIAQKLIEPAGLTQHLVPMLGYKVDNFSFVKK